MASLKGQICQSQSLPSGHVSENLSYMTLMSTQLIPHLTHAVSFLCKKANTMLSTAFNNLSIYYTIFRPIVPFAQRLGTEMDSWSNRCY